MLSVDGMMRYNSIFGMPMLLLQQIGSLYDAKQVTFCQEDVDGHVETLKSVFVKEMTTQYVRAIETPYLFNQSDQETTGLGKEKNLIFCPSFDMTPLCSQVNGHYLSASHVWVTYKSGADIFDCILLRLDSNMVTYQEINDGILAFSEHYKIKGHEVVTVPLGQWTHKDGLILQTDIRWWERRSNLNGAILVDFTLPYSPYVIEIHDQEGLKLLGLMPALMDALQEVLNFTRIITYPEDGEYGKQKVTNESKLVWSGIVGDLANQRGDIRYEQHNSLKI